MVHSHKTRGGSTTVFSLSGDVKWYKPKEGRNKIVILPFEIKSEKHPLVATNQQGWEIGEQDYVMDIYIHRRIGPMDKDIVCPLKSYNKKCPICELEEEYKEQGKDKEAGLLRSSRRAFYNVINVNKPEAGVLIFGVSHKLFEIELIDESRASAEDDSYINFSDLNNGCVIEFRGKTEYFGKNEYLEFRSFKFRERSEEIDEAIEDCKEDVVSFDECLNLLNYEEIRDILYGADENEEEEKSKKRKSKKKENEIDDEEVYENDEENNDEEISKKNKKKDKKKSTKEKMKKKKSRCPHGYEFGIDVDQYKDCDDCDEWEDCSEEEE